MSLFVFGVQPTKKMSPWRPKGYWQYITITIQDQKNRFCRSTYFSIQIWAWHWNTISNFKKVTHIRKISYGQPDFSWPRSYGQLWWFLASSSIFLSCIIYYFSVFAGFSNRSMQLFNYCTFVIKTIYRYNIEENFRIDASLRHLGLWVT